MFQFPRCPPKDDSSGARPCVGRVAPFGDLRIAGCQRLPGAFRRVAASFLGRQRQGIHHALVFRNAPHPRSHAGPARATRTWQHAAIAAGGQGLLRPCYMLSRLCRCPCCHAQQQKQEIVSFTSCPCTRRPGPHRVHHDRSRPPDPTGPTWRIVKVHPVHEVHGSWAAMTPAGRRPAQVEPRGFEPRTSAVQGRRSPG